MTQMELPKLTNDYILQERYKILELIATDTNNVYLGRDLKFPNAVRNVAIKEFFVPPNEDRDDLIRKFNRQANILAQLSHPTIPQIYDYFDIGEQAYIIMQYIKGNSFDALLRQDQLLTTTQILEWAIDICDALHYLHTFKPNPIMFRLIKPSSVIVDEAGKARLVGFRTAKTFIENSKGTQIGAEGYSAPESYKGLSTPLSDMYSLGATLHHLLTRTDPALEPPFSFFERPIHTFLTDAGNEIEKVIDKSLQWKEADRYADMLEMKNAIEQVYFSQKTSKSLPLTTSKSVNNKDALQLFISYKRNDEEFARKVHKTLSELGFNVWLDIVNIRAGEDWSDSIHQGLINSDILLLILTPESMASSNVADEWKYFHSREKPIIPVRLRAVQEIHYQLDRLQYIDFVDQEFQIAVSKLTNEINRIK